MLFAEAWIEAWNRRDIERVLDLYADDFSFTSPTALEVIGQATVVDKGALRGYWQTALAKMDDRHFSRSESSGTKQHASSASCTRVTCTETPRGCWRRFSSTRMTT